MGKTALVLGATGVVGMELVRELCDSPDYDEVEAWARREIGFCHPKLRARIIDFEGISDIAPHKFDEIFCALGTTMKQAGSRGQFYKVDVNYPVNIAKWGIASGARRFALISSQGADERSRFFYLRAKGKAEKKIAALGFKSLQIARLPAIKSEREQVRMGELFTIWLFGLLPKFILTNYRPMSAKDIAASVIAAAQTEAKGVQIYHPREFI
ncbi:NAD-dependent epimerase/dehydratase family protein [Campylobacter showae]|uniref:Oxidoreductase htatip2 n=1 Tax=Campylobacter showae CC57C TaxID=1073353 RepID=M3GVI4_9BACT|nr:NAD-dependent epimerase/dehydratase family protein [Campylobacter showae]EMG29465.1 oxidoreductase htatip2 [Campylobacter showae CC57C]